MKFRPYHYLIPLVIIIVAISCKKNRDKTVDPALAGYKITLVSGANQADTTGNTLKDKIVFKITQNGDSVSNGYLRFETYNCDGEMQFVDVGVGENNLNNSATISYGYKWRLNGIPGTQSLTAVLLDSLKMPRDSVTVMAIAIQPTGGWHTSGCIPFRTFSVSFCQLPSGRILTALHQTDYPYYSDDDGMTWHALKTVPAKYMITKLISTPENEVFLSVSGTGLFYSKDGGQTWEKRNAGLPAISNFFGNIYYTKTEKLFCYTGVGVYTSNDKGVSWHAVPYGLSNYGFSNACSSSDSTIYGVSNNSLYESWDGGDSWKPVYTIGGNGGVEFVFVDDNDDIYVGAYSAIFVSKDHGVTWTNVYTVVPPSGFDASLSQITKQNGNYYFYSTSGNFLTRTNDFATYSTINPPVVNNNGRESFRYIVTKSDHLILSTEFYGLYYYIP